LRMFEESENKKKKLGVPFIGKRVTKSKEEKVVIRESYQDAPLKEKGSWGLSCSISTQKDRKGGRRRIKSESETEEKGEKVEQQQRGEIRTWTIKLTRLESGGKRERRKEMKKTSVCEHKKGENQSLRLKSESITLQENP